MKTSSFFVAGRFPGAVSIAYSAPRWFHGERHTNLLPPRDYVENCRRRLITWDKYAALYRNVVLSSLNPRVVYEQLHVLVGGEPILCCWEPPGEPCVRRVIAGWFEEDLGIVVPELEVT